MNKKLKIELFNIYDVIVFEDENGITQDCVCGIRKDKEVECNSHRIDIFENGNYIVLKKDGFPYYITNKKIIHLYTLKNDNRFYEVYPTDDYEDIDNTEHSEALELIKRTCEIYADSLKQRNLIGSDIIENQINEALEIIKHALIKTHEQEKVLNELLFLVKDLESTFNRKNVSNDTDILGTIIKDYFYDNASDLLKRWLKCQKN